MKYTVTTRNVGGYNRKIRDYEDRYVWVLKDEEGIEVATSEDAPYPTVSSYTSDTIEVSYWDNSRTAQEIGEEWARDNGYPLEDEDDEDD